MKLFLYAAVLILTCRVVPAGTITGMVRAESRMGADDGSSPDGAYASRKYKFVERVDYAAMHDFTVFIEGKVGTNNMASTNMAQVATTKVAQKDAIFSPHVLPIMVGTTVEWPNNDTICHNVFSMSDAKLFDLDLYKGNPPEKRVTFNQPGRVDVFCSIHANMHCVVLVLDNPYFASTDGNGRYAISNVPPGIYKLKAWHERLPADEREIIVPANGGVKADFVLKVKNLPKY
ncbi:MAG: carboxypeptidase regulatory-like domain-containing protein [Verrucomicrobiales bacterium]|nr:carboxypeptidase regulatory-like domain-containing protein [Verrucomicrobiales bacterium]